MALTGSFLFFHKTIRTRISRIYISIVFFPLSGNLYFFFASMKWRNEKK